ncbi:hypothetical protein [Paenibacillus silvae]|uniref:hypothetical protein n=1 Tax=Paenibacillus silvae TaxID=1325358 RepID=UPI002004A2A8|nr:hypothetical protein [Paenibacillus silvae]MCK6076344.1 hypothetical protein [Paenibacillus silvae]MCK6078301.1 hypothetical protein [Paenibacillus silvae]MCK6150497.1 hypothetical protein [Paenibacillus silvae]MCK6268757.1 hypothetical protein [Paenibacillus silvae]MCK6270350.1 hypothetical protein [Paenibacillus silvae]
MIELDISKQKFELYDFTESVIQFKSPSKIIKKFSLDIWGIIIPIKMFSIEQYGLGNDLILFNDNVYISGFSTIYFEDVDSIEIEVELLSEMKPHEHIYQYDGSKCKIKKKWGSNSSSEGYNYEIFSSIDWPFGSGFLSIIASGKATLEIEPERFIPLNQYILNTSKYGLNINGD